MLTYYLDDTQVDCPQRLDGLTLKKARHETYFGFLYQKLGYLEAQGDFLFEQPDAVRLLRYQFAAYGVQAKTRFRIKRQSRTLYDGFIDYREYVWNGEGVSVSLRDENAVADLEAQAVTDYGIELGDILTLHSRRIGGVVQLLTDPNTLTIQRSEPNPTPISHSVPLTRKNEKDDTVSGMLVPVVTPKALDPFYRNTTTLVRTIQVTGIISVALSASAPLTATLSATALTASEQVSDTVFIGAYGLTSSPTVVKVVVRVNVLVQPGGSLRLSWSGSATASNWKFTYQTDTVLSVTDEANKPASTAPCITTLNLLKQLVFKATGGQLQVRSKLFESGEGKGLLFSNGAGIRGVNRVLTTNLEAVFVGLDSIYNLALWVDPSTATVWIDSKANAPKRITRIRQVTTVSQKPATIYSYSQVKAGYTTWKGESLLAGEEPFGSRTYSTGISIVRNELDIRSELIAASTLIEEQRQKQFELKTGSSGKVEPLDDALFVICAKKSAGGWAAETGTVADYVEGVFEPSTIHNLRITPRQNLQRWQGWLQSSVPLTLESAEGGTSLSVDWSSVTLSEGEGLTGNAITPMLTTVTLPMTMDEYDMLGDYIDLDTPTIKAKGYLMDAEWRKDNQAETGLLTILTHERNS